MILKQEAKLKKWGAVDENGEVIIDFVFDTLKKCNHGNALVPKVYITERDSKWGLLDDNGSVLLPNIYESLEYFGEDAEHIMFNGCYFKVSQKRKFGLIDFYGKEIINTQWDNIIIEDLHGIAVVKDGLKQIFDYSNNKIIPFKFLEYDETGYNIFPFHKTFIGNGWGINDNNGQAIIPHIFDDIEVMRIPWCNLQDDETHKTYSTNYDSVFDSLGRKESFYTSGLKDIKIVINSEMQSFHEKESLTNIYNELFFIVKQGNKWGLNNPYTTLNTPIAYDKIEIHPMGLIELYLDAEVYYMRLDGKKYFTNNDSIEK